MKMITKKVSYFFSLLWIASVSALTVSSTDSKSAATTEADRRSFIFHNLSCATLAASAVTFSRPASATLMDTSSEECKAFKPGVSLGVEKAKQRFKSAIADVDELIENYDEICKGGGDNVRRYIGTVGVTSHMYGITKVLKELRDEAEDIVEFTETYNEFEAYLFQAEGAAYQSLFVEHSSAKGTPETFLATAKNDVIQMRKYMGDLAKQLNL
jgi:hypothetical protein